MSLSVFSCLTMTMPIGIGISAARGAARLSASEVLSPAQLFPYIKPLAKTADFSPPVPAVPPDSDSTPPAATVAAQRLWSFDHKGSSPDSIANVTARVRDTGYKRHAVLQSINWGRLDGTDITPEVEVITDKGTSLKLPLKSDYIHSKYYVTGGWVGQNSQIFHPLEMYLDYGLVIAFAYDVSGDQVKVYTPPSDDPSEKALSDYLSGGDGTADPGDNRWFTNMMNGSFMPSADDTSTTAGSSAPVAVFKPCILLAVSIAMGRERADFEPGGMVGMARLYPHIMARTSTPLQKISAAVKLARPAQTRQMDGGDGSVPGICCSAYTDIKSVLVADSNEDPIGPDIAFKPFWSGLFSYYREDPDVSLSQKQLKLVRRDKPGKRTVNNCGSRTLPMSPESLTDIGKMPRQGEFDNIHVSPRLKMNATKLIHKTITSPINGEQQTFDPGLMKIDPITMAPFCSHDCFHMHWRWGPDSVRQAKGWGPGITPYTVPGAPLVPQNHDVGFMVTAPATVIMIDEAFPTVNTGDDTSKRIDAGNVEFFFYAGAAYAQGVVGWRQTVGGAGAFTGAKVNMWKSSTTFVDPGGKTLDLSEPSVFYWNLRYYAESNAAFSGGWKARPYIGSYGAETREITDAEVDRARGE